MFEGMPNDESTRQALEYTVNQYIKNMVPEMQHEIKATARKYGDTFLIDLETNHVTIRGKLER